MGRLLLLRLSAFVLATATMSACGILTPPADLDRDAHAFIDLLIDNKIDSAMTLLDVSGNPDTVRAVLRQGQEFLRHVDIDSAKLIGWNVVRF